MSSAIVDRAPISALVGLHAKDYGQLVASRYAARDDFGRVRRPNLVIWTTAPTDDDELVDPAAVEVLMPLTDAERALMTVPKRYTTMIPGEKRAIACAAARCGVELGKSGAPQAQLDWLGHITAAVLDLARTR